MNIVIPAAGNGQRFKEVGYPDPKPFIPLDGQPMLKRIWQNLKPEQPHTFYWILRAEHLATGKFPKEVGGKIISLDEPTEGALQTVLRAKEWIDNEEPLLIANCDQLIAFNVDHFTRDIPDKDGSLVTFKSRREHHSYVQLNSMNNISKIAEKNVISSYAVAGVYYFRHGQDFVRSAEHVIEQQLKTKGEYYVSSAIDDMIELGYRLGTYDAPSLMLGTPEEMQTFETVLHCIRRLF